LSSSQSVEAKSAENALASSKGTVTDEGDEDKDDLLLMTSCEDYEISVAAGINFGGILQGATLHNVNINCFFFLDV
jgi:hypothetical protein